MVVKRIQCEKPHKPRAHQIRAIVIHATGTTDLDKILRYYQTSSSGIGPHYMISLDGTVYQFAEESETAYHCGRSAENDAHYAAGREEWLRVVKGDKARQLEPFSGYASWCASWPTLDSPLDLETGSHPNGRSIGIECQSPKHRLPAVFTDEQYATLRELVAEVAARCGVPLARRHVLGHSDVDPISRCGKGGSWDPGEGFEWGRVLAPPTPTAPTTSTPVADAPPAAAPTPL